MTDQWEEGESDVDDNFTLDNKSSSERRHTMHITKVNIFSTSIQLENKSDKKFDGKASFMTTTYRTDLVVKRDEAITCIYQSGLFIVSKMMIIGYAIDIFCLIYMLKVSA